MAKPFYTAYPDPGNDPVLTQADPVYLRLDKSGRGGKAVTQLSGLQMHPAGKEEMLVKFKKMCGAGGTVNNGVLEIQGDQRDRLQAELEKMGYRVKRSGG